MIDSSPQELSPLLATDEPVPCEVIPDTRCSPFLITCDHAGKRLPRALGTLGLPASELDRHIAWDLGAASVARALSHALGAFGALQVYSRLVIDCNRRPGVPSSIATLSEETVIPGNCGLSSALISQRRRDVFEPYHACIQAELERRSRLGQVTILIAVHSFTPCFKGVSRPWHVGLLYQRDARLARALLELLAREPELFVGDNEPYAVTDLSDYGVIEYGERAANPHIEIEIRQDLLATRAGQSEWAQRFVRLLPEARLLAGI